MWRKLMAVTLTFITLTAYAKSPQKIEHVIYVTLDGVRWQDVFETTEYFPAMRNQYNKELIFYGMPGSHTSIEVASIPVSLPSYQSQMTGAVQLCDGNNCGRVQVETFPEKLVRQYGFAPKDVAMFGTWVTMHDAYQTKNGLAYENVANHPVSEPSLASDTIMQEYNLLQSARSRHEGDRYDIYTYGQAMHYFIKYRPRFLWISLAEADNFAHDKDIAGYHARLRVYDDYLAQLFSTLNLLGMGEKTMVIVTTDHGRGNGDNWSEHGPEYPESKQTWAFVWHGQLEPVARSGNMKHYSTLSIRPTVERVFAA